MKTLKATVTDSAQQVRLKAKREPSDARMPMVASLACVGAVRAGVVGSMESPRGRYPGQVLPTATWDRPHPFFWRKFLI
jgi:hypothetical protein